MKKVVDNIADIIYECGKALILMLFVVSVLWLFLLSVYGTSHITIDASERTYLLKDNPFIHLLIICIMFAAAFFICRISKFTAFYNALNENEAFYNRVKRILLMCIALLGIIWVLSSQYKAGADQYYVLDAAYALKRHDITMFLKDGYVSKYPNQTGIVFIAYLLSFIVGDFNYIFFQLLNVFFVVLIYRNLSKIAEFIGVSKIGQLLVIVLGIMFFPLIMYSSFVYGTIPGLALSTTAFIYEYKFLEKHNIKDAVLAAAAIMFAMMVKNNYLIFMIAMLLYAGLEWLRQRKAVIISVITMIVIAWALQSLVPTKVVEKISGCDLSGGASSYSWIAMGLADNETITDGWYNGYNSSTYINSNYNSKEQAKAAKEQIAGRMADFLGNTYYAKTYFANKTASQWNNPDFQCFWISQVRGTDIEESPWVSWVLSMQGNKVLSAYLNILQTVILFGVVIFIFCRKNDYTSKNMLLVMMVFVGGFIFHMFWEAKCQYTIPYFVMLFPFSVKGYMVAVSALCNKNLKENLKKNIKNNVFKYLIIYAAALLILFVPAINEFYRLKTDEAGWKEYSESRTAESIVANGEYRVKVYNSNIYLALSDTSKDMLESDNIDIKLSGNVSDTAAVLNITSYENVYNLNFKAANRYIYIYDYSDSNSYKIRAGKSSRSKSMEWHISDAGNGTVYILNGFDKALTYDKTYNRVVVSDFEKADNQRFVLEK